MQVSHFKIPFHSLEKKKILHYSLSFLKMFFQHSIKYMPTLTSTAATWCPYRNFALSLWQQAPPNTKRKSNYLSVLSLTSHKQRLRGGKTIPTLTHLSILMYSDFSLKGNDNFMILDRMFLSECNYSCCDLKSQKLHCSFMSS